MDSVGLEPGSEVGGYRIVAPLGSGGMGTVYRAEDGGGSPVALKLLHPHVGADPASRERLRREVAALQRLRHPGVAAVLDAEADSTEAFLVTELVVGRSLEQHVREHGALAPAELVDLADGLRDALEAVHAAGVVHRDLKPGNVMLTDDGPVLIDFGIAQAAEDVRVTSTGFVVGTPGYLAPELLADGDPSAETDWWGWAAVLAFAATGRPPFGTRPLDAVIARTRAGDADLIGLGPVTAGALEGALDPEPARRTPPDEVVAALDHALDADERPAAPTEVLTVAIPPRRSTRTEPTAVAWGPDAATRALPDDAGTRALPQDAPTRALPDDAATRALPQGAAAPTHDGNTQAMPAVPADPGPGGSWGPEAGYGGGVPSEATPGGPRGYGDGGDPDGGYGAGGYGPSGYGPPSSAGWDGGPGQGPDAADAGAIPEAAGATAYVPPRPRRRTGTVLALGLLAVAGATLYPGVTVVVVAAALLLLRTVGTAAEAVQRRRERRGGVGRGDVARALVASPWHLLRAFAGLLPSLLVAASVVTIVGGLLWWALQTGRLTIPAWGIGPDADGTVRESPAGTWTASAVLAAAVLAGLVAAWWGPLSRGTRAGARWTLGALAPGWSGAAVLSALALAGAAVLAVLAATGQPIVWWPLPGPPSLR
ncbi:serine/threonine-protein kinase [Cellulomonas aerilata]|uniref:Protein kinase domain-containing protein n=1 Tax=Cellulomonas aerilata TaxID=515326 RepID=A0A512DEE9_9CELL|nr:serine/threonine-protein kinase [Cellulomonas aerilata]GEO34849.1 hypothetical protein CAE01nite_25740 [Cellulomonas aerilata]